jgi:hypothetical protein
MLLVSIFTTVMWCSWWDKWWDKWWDVWWDVWLIWPWDKVALLNSIPKVGNSSIKYATEEWKIIEIPFSKIIKDALVSDPDNNTLILEAVGNYDQSIVFGWDKITFTAPWVENNENFSIKFKAKDSKWAYATENITVTFTSVDKENDSPLIFNPSDVEIKNYLEETTDTIEEWQSFSIIVSPIDKDWVREILLEITNPLGDLVEWFPLLLNRSEAQVITLKGSWKFIIKVTSIWELGPENPTVSTKTVTKNLNVVANIPIEITDINIQGTISQWQTLTWNFNVSGTPNIVWYDIIGEDGVVYYSDNLTVVEDWKYFINYDVPVDQRKWVYRVVLKSEGNVGINNSVVTQFSPVEIVAPNTAPTIDISNMTINWNPEYEEGIYTAYSNSTLQIRDLVANDPDWIWSYTITSALFGALIEWEWNIPEVFDYTTGTGKYGKEDTLTIEVTDNKGLTTTKTVEVIIN